MSEQSKASPPRVYLPPVTIEEHVNLDSHLLLWQVRGESDFLVAGRESTLRTGDAQWIPSGVWHGFTTNANSVLLPAFFVVAETATTINTPVVVAVDRDLETLLLAYFQTTYSIIRPNVDIARQILSLLEQVPAVMSSRLPMPHSASVVSIAEALRFNPGDVRGVDELAASVHTSARTIERLFRSETGMTLRAWRIKNRMEVAGRLLRSQTTIEAVARRVGYTDASAFRRVFRAHFAMSPREYVAQYRPGS